MVLLVPLYAWEAARTGPFRIDGAALAAIAYVSIFASVIAFLCWNRGVAAVGAAKAGLYFHLMPVFAALLAMAFLDERLKGFHLLGVALVALGLGLSTRAKPAP
jgi:drug/metabolite transporter (DMT)-like permease